MTLEQLQNLVSELGKRFTADIEVLVADSPYRLFDPPKVIAGHYEGIAGDRLVLILGDVPERKIPF